jgi:ubiquinone/menaquinone biosynthesis C-methylase UbiE
MSAFARRARIDASTAELNRQEMQWWDTNAPLIERIWGLPDPICREARRGYIGDIRGRFHELLGVGPLKILEIACGTGWPGRLLASPSLKVTGVDFSEGQIEIARAKAAEGKHTNCDYVRMDIDQMQDSFRSNQFDGSFIHCGIHHLSTAELRAFIDSLARAPKGFPTILVEPVYLDKAHLVGRIQGKVLSTLYKLLQRLYFAREPQDEFVITSAQKLSELANDRGWFFSPKEVPFDIGEVTHLFSPNFEIKEIVPVTHFGLAGAQYLATLKDQDKASRFAARSLPLLNSVDRSLIKTRLLPTLTEEYLFCRIVLIRK